jgi:glucose-6-phosphate 1-dehydrogenase
VQLRQELKDARRPLHYLAIPPSLFATVAEGLAKQGAGIEARLVVEKPFGHNRESARQLDRILNRFYPEENIFRIDHYLGKEPVQNIRGQYAGYRSAPGIKSDSTVETFIAAKLFIGSWRWAGVPIYIRAGAPIARSGDNGGFQKTTSRILRGDRSPVLGSYANKDSPTYPGGSDRAR